MTALNFRATITGNEQLNPLHYLITLKPLDLALVTPRAGQFYMISTGNYPEPLLKRPFCALSHKDGSFQMLYRVKGKGTTLLSNMPTGAVIDVLGPLGNWYPAPEPGTKPVIIAGGIGIASVYPLIDGLKGQATVIYGSRSREDIMLYNETEALAGRLTVCTDDCTFGEAGTVIDVMNRAGLTGPLTIYACGPRGMLRALKEWMITHGHRTGYVSLEEHMACGIGACMGCVVLTEGGYKRVCKDGPVFPVMEVVL